MQIMQERRISASHGFKRAASSSKETLRSRRARVYLRAGSVAALAESVQQCSLSTASVLVLFNASAHCAEQCSGETQTALQCCRLHRCLRPCRTAALDFSRGA
eukprot:6193596-Pleurochrysis_carterae.AAC.1